MRTTVVEAVAALGDLAGKDVTAWSDVEVRDGLAALLTAHHRLAAVVSTVVGSFDRRDLSVDDGCRTTRTWLTAFGRMSQGAATGWLTSTAPDSRPKNEV